MLGLLLMAGMAGCLNGDETESLAAGVPPGTPAAQPHAVVALIDTGINPYHVDFRDDSNLSRKHPSTYLPGYPSDAQALVLTLNASDLEAAMEADEAVWDAVEPNTLYWIPGTKIVGAYTTGGRILDTGHGTMTASRAAGNGYSLCPECRIAAVQGFTGDAVTWASGQAWIDAQSNSWSPQVVFQQADVVQESGLAEAFEAAATRHLVFGSAGNGIAGKFGVVGHPSFTRSTSGPLGVVSVGGHDNGEVILWSGSWPHVVADACDNWAAVGRSLDEYSGSAGGGTSSASPYAAGATARMVLEARRLLGDDHSMGVQDGVLARGSPVNATFLDDGIFTLEEAKTLLMRSATPRPVFTEHDGENCGMTGAPYNTYPVAWGDVPAEVPPYMLIGYGQISVDSSAVALSVLAGGMDLPERPREDAWHDYAEELRQTYNGLPR